MEKRLEGYLSTVDEGVTPNLNFVNVSKNRTPIVNRQGKTKLILSQSSIYRQASDLHERLGNNIATFSTQGLAVIPVDKLLESDSNYDIYQLGEGKVGAQITMFYDTGSDSNYCLAEFAETYKFEEIG